MPGVFVGPSIWRQINVRTATALMAAMMDNPTSDHVIFAPTWNDALIGRSRSLMCTAFLDTDCDVMLIIDDDIVFDPNDFWKIVEGCRDTRGIYGGAYVTRSTTPHITSRAFPDGKEQVFQAGPARRPIEYQYLATGFFALHRDVMEAMVAEGVRFEDAYGFHGMDKVELGGNRPFWPVFSPFVCKEEDGRFHYLSEDWAFCNRWRQLGGKVWVDLSIILQHMGEYPYTVADLKTLEKPGLPSAGTDVMTADSRLQTFGEPLIDEEMVDLAEFTEDDPGDVRRFSAAATEALYKLWLSRSERELDWYKREDVGYHFLGDLAHWHRRGFGLLPATLMDGLRGKRLMDFGAGSGLAALRFAEAGADVLAVEPNPVMRRFAEFRAAKRGISLQTSESPEGQGYDAIMAWHVFEHIEDAEGALDDLLSRMKPGGFLISQSGFHDASTPMHHVLPPEEWEATLASRGLVADPVWADEGGNSYVYRYAEVAVPV